MGQRLEVKARLIRALAEYLSNGAAHKSILLEMGKPEAKEWAKLRNAANLMGNMTVEETVQHLEELL